MLAWVAWTCLIFLSPVFAADSVTVSPGGVFEPGANTSFICSAVTSVGVVDIQWFVNGTVYNGNIMNVERILVSSFDGGQIERLSFTNLPLEYSTTTIRCSAEFNSGMVIPSMESTILIQGPLPAVGSLMGTQQDSTIFLNWTASDALDPRFNVTGYCVDVVVNSTSSPILYSECEINMTEFTYPIPPGSGCDSFLFTVTPVNVLGNGTILTTQPYSGPETSPKVRDVVRIGVSSSSLPPIYTYSLNMSAPVCSSQLAYVDLDLDTGEEIIGSELTVGEDNITFTTEQLTVNRGYNVRVRASNSAGSVTSYTTISTHDVVNATVVENNLTVTYSEFSVASGVLFNFVFVGDDVDFTKSALWIFFGNDSSLPFDLFPGQYRIFVYDIEQDGTLYNGVGYPAVTADELTVSGTDEGPTFQPQHIENCDVNVSSGLIAVMCTQYSNSTADGFQMIVQLNDINKVHILYVNQTMNQEATVQTEENGLYQVTVLAVIGGQLSPIVEYTQQLMVDDVPTPTTSGTVNTPDTTVVTGTLIAGNSIGTGIIIAIVVIILIAIAIAIVVVVVIVILMVKKKPKVHTELRNNHPPSTDAAEMQAVYDEPNRQSASTDGLLNDPYSGAPEYAQINKPSRPSKKVVDDHKDLNYEVVVTKKPTEGRTFEVAREVTTVIYSDVKPHTRGDEEPPIPPKATQPVDENNTEAVDDFATNV